MALNAYIPNFSKDDFREDHGSGTSRWHGKTKTSHKSRCPEKDIG